MVWSGPAWFLIWPRGGDCAQIVEGWAPGSLLPLDLTPAHGRADRSARIAIPTITRQGIGDPSHDPPQIVITLAQLEVHDLADAEAIVCRAQQQNLDAPPKDFPVFSRMTIDVIFIDLRVVAPQFGITL